MKSYKIGLLILTTSNKRDKWINIKDTYLFNYTVKTFLKGRDKEHEYIFYIGIDSNDRIFDNLKQQEELLKFNKIFPNINFNFITMDGINKGHVTKMWNKLFKIAYNDNCDYFFQCGDDINFKTNNWINSAIKVLKKNNDIGLTGPLNNNNRILTQAFVSRKHMEIFNFFFPEEIINWWCDDWYNFVYSPEYFYPLSNHYCSNEGGMPRYDIDNNPNFMNDRNQAIMISNKKRLEVRELANKHKIILINYIK